MRVGDVVAGRFDVEALAASGGMGQVWRARDRQTGGPVALKFVQGGGKPAQKERFSREARLLAELAHPAIVRYVAHGLTRSGEPYLAMEWLEGDDLGTRLERAGLSVWESVALGTRLAEALAGAHARGIIHRDLKPSNVILVDGQIERAKLVDFGIAHFADATLTHTRTGAILGTPGYMAPEQARGAHEIDARADVYSLGCVLFECLTGRPPVTGEHVMAILAKILLEEAPRVSELLPDAPPALDDLVARMLAKDPARRPASCAEVVPELVAISPETQVQSQRARPSLKPPALTGGELRFVNLVIAAPPGSAHTDESAPTLTSEESDVADEPLREAVAAMGARLERLADGSFAASLVGTGSATDQTARAARCALAMRVRLPETPIVLATGRGVLGGQLPVGDIIDRAAQLLRVEIERAAAARAAGRKRRLVRIDQVTAGLLDARFEVSGDVDGLVLRAERQTSQPVRTLLGKPTACVGRERELGALAGLLDECAEEPMARAALVTSPPGIGKSRLLYEFLARVEQRRDPVQVWIARGDPISAGSPFGLVAQAIRGAVGLREGEPIEVRRHKILARVGRHQSPPSGGREESRKVLARAQRVAEFLGELIGTPFPDENSVQLRSAREDPLIMGDQMRRAWEDLLAAECAARPVLLVLEDLHWGDLPTVQFVDSALRNLHDRPFFVLALARPEVHDVFPKLWSERSVQSMPLGELTRRASEKLVRQVLGEAASPDVTARVVERAGGNALYLEELIRAVADGRGDALPETVVAMVQARLESLPDEARRVLRAASVFGQTFWRGGTIALLGGSNRTTQSGEWLEHLVEREVVLPHAESKFPGEEEFSFRHTLVREAAYAMLTDRDRALGHRLAGDWLENAGEGDAVALAEHFERGGQPQRALACWQRAAREALEGSDLDAALARAERAIGCGAREETLGALRALEAEAHMWQGHNAETARSGSEAMSLLPRGSVLWNAAAHLLAEAWGHLGETERFIEVADALYEAPTNAATLASWTAAASGASVQLMLCGHRGHAERMIARIDERSASAHDPMVKGWLERLRAWRGTFEADLAAGLSHELAAASFEEAGNLRYALRERTNLGYTYLLVGRYDLAERVLRDALGATERLGLRYVAATARNNLSLVLAWAGRLEEGRAMGMRAVDDFRKQGDARMIAASLSYLARIELHMGLPQEALESARAGLEASTEHTPIRAQAFAAIAEIDLATGGARLALDAAREAMAILASPAGVEEGHALIRLVHAEALHAVGEVDAAREEMRDARAKLLESAARISDATVAQSFLERVPENVRTLALAREWLGD